MPTAKTAFIAVDVQPDFQPGGALAVADGDQVTEPILELAAQTDLLVATRDWHPAGHCSFTEQGGTWPVHCVADTPGAQIDPRIEQAADIIISKATETDKDAYSGFEGTDLAEQLRARGVTEVWVGGLATDYCVKATVLDAIAAGFTTVVFPHAARAVNVNEGDEEAAIAEMRVAGAEVRALEGVVR